MTTILSSLSSILLSISGQFVKELIFGALLPVTIFMILWSIFIKPIIPIIQSLLYPLGLNSQDWPLIAIGLIIIFITGILNSLNVFIIRFFEGYPWQLSYLGRLRTAFHRKKFKEAKARQNGMRTLLRAMDAGDPHYTGVVRYWSESGEIFKRNYPNRELLILPTRLGNVIRSFERYPDEQYRMESFLLWTRLMAKIDKEYAGVITDTKISLDFMLNSALLSAILSFSALAFGLVFAQNTFSSLVLAIIWLVKIFGFLITGYLFYLGAISRAFAWGETIKSAYDLYRWDLLKQMGYQQIPKTRRAERQLWGNISVQMIYGDHPDRGPLVDYAEAPSANLTSIMGQPESRSLKVSRGVTLLEDNRSLKVVLEAKNPDKNWPVSQVILIDHVPDGFEYVWSPVDCANRTVSVEGTNPYHFSIGDLAPGETVYLSYIIVQRVRC